MVDEGLNKGVLAYWSVAADLWSFSGGEEEEFPCRDQSSFIITRRLNYQVLLVADLEANLPKIGTELFAVGVTPNKPNCRS